MTVRALRAGARAEHVEAHIGAGQGDSSQDAYTFASLLNPLARSDGATRNGPTGTDGHLASDKLPHNVAPYERTMLLGSNFRNDASGQWTSAPPSGRSDATRAGLESRTFSFRQLGVFGLYDQIARVAVPARMNCCDDTGVATPTFDTVLAAGEAVKWRGPTAQAPDIAVKWPDAAPTLIPQLGDEQGVRAFSSGPMTSSRASEPAPAALVGEPPPRAAGPAVLRSIVGGWDEEGPEPCARAPAGQPAPDVPQSPARNPVALSVSGGDATIGLVVRSIQDSPEALRAALQRIAAEFRCRIGELVLNGTTVGASPSQKGVGHGRHTR